MNVQENTEEVSITLIPPVLKIPDEGDASKYAAIFGIGFLTLGYSAMEVFPVKSLGVFLTSS